MKVVDMFGCGLPVCARAYSCINELVVERGNGLLFSSPSELADQLLELFQGFPQVG
jgi:beta-1,4-mannosyltransferase